MATQLPQKEHTSPHFSAHVCCGRKAGRIKMPLGTEVDFGPSDIALDGDPAPPPQKMPLGTEVSLDPDDIVLDGDPVPPPNKGHSAPIFGPCLLWRNGRTDQDATWHGGRPRPRRHCVRRGPIPHPKRGHSTPPHFSAHVYCGQTVAHLSYC